MTGRDATMSWEPKTTTEYDLVDYATVDPKLLEAQAELYKQVVLQTLIGRCEDGMAEYWDWVGKARDNRKTLGTGVIKEEPPTELPPKVCNYRKPKVYWFGEAGNNVPYSIGTGAAHFAVIGDTVEGLRGRRFIGISEPVEQHWDMIDNDFLHRLTGDVWVETRTLNKSSKTWEPQGEIFIGGSKPLKINEKSEEQIERVKGIEFRVV